MNDVMQLETASLANGLCCSSRAICSCSTSRRSFSDTEENHRLSSGLATTILGTRITLEARIHYMSTRSKLLKLRIHHNKDRPCELYIAYAFGNLIASSPILWPGQWLNMDQFAPLPELTR